MRKRQLPFSILLAGLLTAGMSLSLRVADVSDGMDKAGRRELYKQLRLPPDSSIKK